MARVLGVDFGERRVGLAVSDPDGAMALPLRTAEVRSVNEALSETRRQALESEAALVVVGLPLNMDGTRGPMAEKAESFARRLRGMLPVPVRTWDERLSTAAVERMLIAADVSRARRRRSRDKLAAQVILQGYLDAQIDRYADPLQTDPGL